jgi:hypothetical protein
MVTVRRLYVPAFALLLAVACVAYGASLSSRSSKLRPPSRLSSARGRSTGGNNLCHNGSFDSTNGPLHGWTIDYQWTGNSFYQQNHNRIKSVDSYSGKSKVMHVNGRAGETKVESRAIPFEQGARYRCTLNFKGSTTPHMYFTGYKWKPGIRPYETPHLGDLRRIYKSQFRNTKVSSGGYGWKKVTFEFPIENPSSLAKKHLKYLRFFTVYIIVINDAKGEIYVDDVVVTKIK